MTSKLVKPRKVRCEIILVANSKHLNISEMTRYADLVEDLVLAHNHQSSDRILCVVDWPEVEE